jgi:threonine/homoserine/homoserine lactone efflux protein
MHEVAAFIGLAAIVIALPGPDTALTVRNTLLGGRRAGVFTGVGVVLGQLVWAIAAAAGVAALLAASEPLFLAVKLAGAAYLCVLGVLALRAAWRGQYREAATGGRPRLAVRRALRQGFLSNLGNPKMAVFFMSLLPQFVDRDGATFFPMLGLAAIFGVMTLLWLVAVAQAGAVLRRARVRRTIEALTGTVLVALGLRLATEGS